MPSASDYVAELVAQGQYHFTTDDAVAALGESVSRVRAALRRLEAKGELVDPHRSFHVVLPSEHRRFGCPPATDFVPPLMRHLHEPYYVALLSAAELYGAAHARNIFQVLARPTEGPSIVASRACSSWGAKISSGHRELANVLVPLVKDLAGDFAPLVRARPKAGARRVQRWKLAVNASV